MLTRFPSRSCILPLLTLFLVLSHNPISAQEKLLPVFHFNHLTTADGLPTNNIFGVVRDSKGFVWVGTGNGLSRYDGYAFKTYRNVLNDSTSLSSSMIMMVKEDRKHRLWVGTWDAGLSLYDPSRDHFVNFYARPGDSSWLQTRTVYSMLEDSAGVLWFGTSNGYGGVVRVDLPSLPEGSDVERLASGIHFKTYPLGTPHNGANDLCMHSDGRILVASDSGLLLFDRKTGLISRPGFPGPDNRRLNSVTIWRLVQDGSSNLWLPTSGGLFRINWRDGRVQNYRHSKDDSLSIARDNLLDAALDRQGNIWIASSEGVDIFSPATGKRMPYLTSGSRPEGNANVMLSVDQTGTLWISTGGNGLYSLSKKSQRFPHYSHGHQGASAGGFETIERTKEGKLWICSNGNVYQVDIQTRTIVKSVDVLRGAKSTYWDCNRHTSFLDEQGILWYGIWGPGLYRVDLAKQQVMNFQYPDQRHAGDAAVRSIAPGSGDSLWIAATHDGLWKFDPASGRFVRGSTTPFARANDVLKDRDGNIWVATILDGLYRIDPATDSVEHFVHDPSNPNSLSNDRTNNLYEDPSGRIWFGAVSVINVWNPATRTFTRYPNPAFAEENSARVIGSDRTGRQWASYGDGQVAMLNPHTGLFVNFDASDGVCGYVVDMENLDDGKVLLSGSTGLNIFDPDSVLHYRRAAPPLEITRISINDQPIVLSARLNEAGSLSLPYDQNVMELEFAALDIDAPQLVEYQYQLEGLEKEWVKPENRRFVRYPGLPPGDYMFKVRAASSRDEWPGQEVALAISIAPPWWRTIWAYTAYVLLIVCALYSAYRIRLRQVQLKQAVQLERLEHERALDRERVRISQDMHDEVGSSLSEIAILSELARKDLSRPERVDARIQEISNRSGEIVENIGEIIWAINPNNDPVENLISYLRRYAAHYLELASIRLIFNVPDVIPNLVFSSAVRRNIFLVLKEALHNVVKHSAASLVTINIRFAEHDMELAIEDHGKGFELVERSGFGNGLLNMKKRLDDIGGSIVIQSSPGSGTKIQVFVRG